MRPIVVDMRAIVVVLVLSLAAIACADTRVPDPEGNLELLDVSAQDMKAGNGPAITPRRRLPITLPSNQPWAKSPLANVLVHLETVIGVDTTALRGLLDSGKVVVKLGTGSDDATALYYPGSTGKLILRASELVSGQYPTHGWPTILHELVHGLINHDAGLRDVFQRQLRYEQGLNCRTYASGTSAEGVADETAAYWVELNLAPRIQEIKDRARDAADARTRWYQVFAPGGLSVEIGSEYLKPAAMRSCDAQLAHRLAIVLGVPKRFTGWTLAPPTLPPPAQRAARMTDAEEATVAAAVKQALADWKDPAKRAFGDLIASIKSAVVTALGANATSAPDPQFAAKHALLVGLGSDETVAVSRAFEQLRRERAAAASGR